MTRADIRWKRWTLRQWRCCTHLWEVLLSQRYPERHDWMPACPSCGRQGR